MRIHTIIVASLAAIALLPSCSSQKTGDPNAGGLLGWDRGMAEQRLQNKRSALNLLQNANSSATDDRAGLQGELNSDRATLDRVDRSYC